MQLRPTYVDPARGYGPSPAPPDVERRGPPKRGLDVRELIVDKAIDFLLIFVGLYAAIAVQRFQDAQKEKAEYVALLGDFEQELRANLAQEASIAKDLGAIADTEPGKNLGPMKKTFDDFFMALAEDEKVVHCLHTEFASSVVPAKQKKAAPANAKCHELYAKFDEAHQGGAESFAFTPAVLTPFYRYEVWQLYLADGVKTFRNKELAVKIGEIYSNARIIEKQVADIEATYNDAFMKQVGRSAATDAELAEVVHDEEAEHGLSPQNRTLLLHIGESLKEERYATKEARSILELKVERMKKTVLVMREEIATVTAAIDEELRRLGKR